MTAYSNPTKLNSNIEEQTLLSVSNFSILYILTLGLNGMWWEYKVWRFFNQKEDASYMPAVRVLLSIIFIFPLFHKIQDYAKANGYKPTYNPVLLAFGYLTMTYVFYLFSRVESVLAILSPLCFVFLLLPNKAWFSALTNDTSLKTNIQTTFNTRQVLLIILGSLYWITMLFLFCINIFV
jgi:hypothetical protein